MNRTKDDTFENSPVMKYILDHSLRLHPAQEKLIEVWILLIPGPYIYVVSVYHAFT